MERKNRASERAKNLNQTTEEFYIIIHAGRGLVEAFRGISRSERPNNTTKYASVLLSLAPASALHMRNSINTVGRRQEKSGVLVVLQKVLWEKLNMFLSSFFLRFISVRIVRVGEHQKPLFASTPHNSYTKTLLSDVFCVAGDVTREKAALHWDESVGEIGKLRWSMRRWTWRARAGGRRFVWEIAIHWRPRNASTLNAETVVVHRDARLRRIFPHDRMLRDGTMRPKTTGFPPIALSLIET